MLVLITYDVNTENAAGRKRLRQIAKQCVNYGQRVQASVFECLLDAAQCRVLQAKLCAIIDPERDSISVSSRLMIPKASCSSDVRRIIHAAAPQYTAQSAAAESPYSA